MKKYSLKKPENKQAFREGMKSGIPIGLGYFAVSFSLGIAAKAAGMDPFQGFLVSILCVASAGEYAGLTVIAALGSYVEIAVATFVANARYVLMSCSMSQRIDPEMPFIHRFFLAYGITDELFGIAIARDGYLNPCFSYGAFLTSIPLWALGTALGIVAGNLMPLRLVSAFSVAIFGMFIAVIVPPARKDKIIAGIIVVCFALSFAATKIPFICDLSDGTRTIILTVLIASLAAILFPKKGESEENES